MNSNRFKLYEYASNYTNGLTNKEALFRTRSRHLDFSNPVDTTEEVNPELMCSKSGPGNFSELNILKLIVSELVYTY